MSFQTFRQADFMGGENRKLLPEFVGSNQVTLAQNCVLTADNLLETRPGKTKVNLVSLGDGGVIAVARYAKENGSKYLVVQHGTSLYAAQWDGSGQLAAPMTEIRTGLASKLRFVVWKDNLICYGPSYSPFRYDGTSCTLLGGSPPGFNALTVYAGRLWGATAAAPNTIRFSALEDYDTWPALNLLKVRDGDGDYITGLSAQPGGLIITKNRSTYPIYGTDNDTLRVGEPFPGRVGCVSTDGLLDAGVLQGVDNWYTFGLNGLEPIAETHTPLLDPLTPSEKSQTFAVYQPITRRALFHLPTGEIVCMDAKRNAVTTWKGLNASCFSLADAADDGGDVLIGDASAGFVYRLSGSSDDGTDIETVIKTPYNHMGSGQDKEWRYFWPRIDFMDAISAYEVFAKYDVDFSNTSGMHTFAGNVTNYLDWGTDYWGQAYWGPGGARINDPYWLHGVRGEYCSFEVKTNQRIRFKGFETKFRFAGRK